MLNGDDRKPSTLGELHSLLHSCFTDRACFLSNTLHFPLSMNWWAIELAVTGQRFGWKLRPERRLNVFHATLLECVKSIPWTVSSHLCLRFVSRRFIRVEAAADASSLFVEARNASWSGFPVVGLRLLLAPLQDVE